MQTKTYSQRQVFRRNRRAGALQLSSLLIIWLLAVVLPFAACEKDKEPTCPSGLAAKGKLVKLDAQNFEYRTSGGGTIRYSNDNTKVIELFHDNYPNFRIEFWGNDAANGISRLSGTHENLNGKHIKDRVGPIRTFIFPDGAKVTFVAGNDTLPITSFTIYEGGECHRISAYCFIVESSTINDAALAQQMDNAEPDGETSTIEFIPTGMHWLNIYTEATPGNKVNKRELLGGLKTGEPNTVNDYYDDPRLGHT